MFGGSVLQQTPPRYATDVWAFYRQTKTLLNATLMFGGSVLQQTPPRYDTDVCAF